MQVLRHPSHNMFLAPPIPLKVELALAVLGLVPLRMPNDLSRGQHTLPLTPRPTSILPSVLLASRQLSRDPPLPKGMGACLSAITSVTDGCDRGHCGTTGQPWPSLSTMNVYQAVLRGRSMVGGFLPWCWTRGRDSTSLEEVSAMIRRSLRGRDPPPGICSGADSAAIVQLAQVWSRQGGQPLKERPGWTLKTNPHHMKDGNVKLVEETDHSCASVEGQRSGVSCQCRGSQTPIEPPLSSGP